MRIIYALTDPTTDEVRYIGKSASGLQRPRSHKHPSLLRATTAKNLWIRKLLSEGRMYGIRVLETLSSDASEADAARAERKWIAEGRRLGWPLTNVTDGGDGTAGFHHTEEAKRRIGAAHLGRYVSPETRKRMSAAGRTKVFTPEHRERIAQANIGRKHSEEWRARQSKGLIGNTNNLGKKRTPETRAKQAEARRRWWTERRGQVA